VKVYEYPTEGTGAKNRRTGYWFKGTTNSHPAILNIKMVEDLIREYAKPCDVLLDPFAGSGTLMIAATEELGGHNVVLLEVENHFVDLQSTNLTAMRAAHKVTGSVGILLGDNRRLLPMFRSAVDLIMFSPPYYGLGSGGHVVTEAKGGPKFQYGTSPNNLGAQSPLMLRESLREIYKLCYQALRPNGLMIVVTQDTIKGGERIRLTADTLRICIELGFSLVDVAGRKRVRTIGAVYHQRDREAAGNKNSDLIIDHEDISILRRPA
jgi:DNA modification methylase